MAPAPAPEPGRLRDRPDLRSQYRGVINYYLLAQDVSKLTRLRWHALTSLLKTLAAKHHSTVTKMAVRYRAKIETSDGLRTCFEARRHREGKPDLVARFGGIPLRQNRKAVIRDPAPARIPYPRKELVRRLRKRICELCETGTTVAVHQVTGLKALGKPGEYSDGNRSPGPGFAITGIGGRVAGDAGCPGPRLVTSFWFWS